MRSKLEEPKTYPFIVSNQCNFLKKQVYLLVKKPLNQSMGWGFGGRAI